MANVKKVVDQPPSGGCVLKQFQGVFFTRNNAQPPSGGCVLKQAGKPAGRKIIKPAAFRRLCVETNNGIMAYALYSPAAFRRLCVETYPYHQNPYPDRPAAFRRLCVETSNDGQSTRITFTSRLQAAVC